MNFGLMKRSSLSAQRCSVMGIQIVHGLLITTTFMASQLKFFDASICVPTASTDVVLYRQIILQAEVAHVGGFTVRTNICPIGGFCRVTEC